LVRWKRLEDNGLFGWTIRQVAPGLSKRRAKEGEEPLRSRS